MENAGMTACAFPGRVGLRRAGQDETQAGPMTGNPN
jgi:hypothetical protein